MKIKILLKLKKCYCIDLQLFNNFSIKIVLILYIYFSKKVKQLWLHFDNCIRIKYKNHVTLQHKRN